ncbi:MAG: ribonuclease HII [Gammaproteobacteria bacterium]|nr:ribonuclease HII [Gammaproteobacteria bacterium]MDG2118281.1 ribonuclease HII [Gammaproteobacteria bacterium]
MTVSVASADMCENCRYIAGTDEVGRGALAGDVIAAAVILDDKKPILGLSDSKKLTSNKRDSLYNVILTQALGVSIGRASVSEIDELNILQASLLAMERAVSSLSILPEYVLVDGIHLPNWNYKSQAIIKGDQKVASIAAASIVAKVFRDRELVSLDSVYPQFDFRANKGYPTKKHLRALVKYGPCPIHRFSFAPVLKNVRADSVF